MAPQKKAEPADGSDDQTLLIKDCRIWTDQGLRKGSILARKGKISRIGSSILGTRSQLVDGKGLLALPGLIDVHVHLRDMRSSYKEDFTSGTSAAAAGGFTTLLDMPNTNPPVVSPARLAERIRVASRKILVNVGFHVAAVRDANIAGRMAAMGAFSFKLYLPHLIAPLEVGSDEALLKFFRVAAYNRTPVTVHAEEPELIGGSALVRSYLDLARTRPSEAESQPVKRILRLQKLAGCSVHFTHITLSSSLQHIQNQHSKRVTAEATPHHLLLSEDELQSLGWKAWMVPPLRRPGIGSKLLRALSAWPPAIVASDHAPHAISEKKMPEAAPGVPGLETTLPLLLTLVNEGRLTLKRMVRMLASNPAKVFGLSSKGRLEVGADADLVLVDPDRRSRINPKNFLSKAKYSPFEGHEIQGVVEKTVVGGKLVFEERRIVAPPGAGKVLRRNR